MVNAYNNRGLAKKMVNDLIGAEKDFSIAIDIKPNFASPYCNRGIIKDMKGDP